MAAGGGAWKVAYADFVTAMMAFFLVMWLTSQKPEVKSAVAGYFADPWGTASDESSPIQETPSDVMTPKSGIEVPGRPQSPLSPHPKDMGATGSQEESFWVRGYRMQVLQEGDRLPPAVTVLFAGDTTALDEEASRLLLDAVRPMLGKSNRMEIRAHSSRRPLSPDSPYQNHWELGFARAQAVMQFFMKQGVEPERMRLSQSASFEPLVDDLGHDWQRENSRVEIYVLNEWTVPKPGTKEPSQPSDKRSVQEVSATTPRPHTEPDHH